MFPISFRLFVPCYIPPVLCEDEQRQTTEHGPEGLGGEVGGGDRREEIISWRQTTMNEGLVIN